MSKTICIDCRKEVPDGTVCSCQKIIKIQSDHFKTLWLGIKIGMILGTKLTISIGNDCNDKDCHLFVPGGVHQKGSTLCKYGKSNN